GRRSECRDGVVEQVVAERLQGRGAALDERQLGHPDEEIAQRRLDPKAQRGELLGESGKRNGCKSRQRQYAVARQLIGILGTDQVDERSLAPPLLDRQLRLCRLLGSVAARHSRAVRRRRVSSCGHVLRSWSGHRGSRRCGHLTLRGECSSLAWLAPLLSKG